MCRHAWECCVKSNLVIDNWLRETSAFSMYIHVCVCIYTYIYIYLYIYILPHIYYIYHIYITIYILPSVNGTCRLIIWPIIIAFHIDFAATFALQSSNLKCISLAV